MYYLLELVKVYQNNMSMVCVILTPTRHVAMTARQNEPFIREDGGSEWGGQFYQRFKVAL